MANRSSRNGKIDFRPASTNSYSFDNGSLVDETDRLDVSAVSRQILMRRNKRAYEQALITAKLAPRDLREFMYPEEVLNGDSESFFDATEALHTLAFHELGYENTSEFIDSSDYSTARNALIRIAAPHFVTDARWETSLHRRVLAEHLPRTLERLESQAEEAFIYRQLSNG